MTEARGCRSRASFGTVPGRTGRVGFLLVLLAAGAVGGNRRADRQMSDPGTDLVGLWRGTGRITANWTAVQSLPLELNISQTGAVHGNVGLARITAARLLGRSGKASLALTFLVSLDGPLLQDGVARRALTLKLRLQHAYLRGSGATDGAKARPWSEWGMERQTQRVALTDVQLERVWVPGQEDQAEPVTPRPGSGATREPAAFPASKDGRRLRSPPEE